MFTIEQIDDIHERLGKQATLPQYLKALKAIGIARYDSFITDGHSEYYGRNNEKVVSPAAHEELVIASVSNREDFLQHLALHEQGRTNYFEMSQGLAKSGIEKWTFDTNRMTIAYYDLQGREMLTEAIS